MQRPNREKTQEVMMVFALAALVFAAWFEARWLLGAAAAALVIGLFVRGLGSWIAWGWLAFSEQLGKFMSALLLSAVFFLLLTPIAWLYRRFTKNPLQLKKVQGSSRSYYTVREHSYTAEDLEHLW